MLRRQVSTVADPDVVRSRSRSAVQGRRGHHPIRLLVLLTLVSLSFVLAHQRRQSTASSSLATASQTPATTSFLPISVPGNRSCLARQTPHTTSVVIISAME